LINALYETSMMVLKNNLAVKPGENLVIITDLSRRRIGEALFQASLDMGAEAILVVMRERSRHGEEPPKPVAEALISSDVFVAPTKYSLTHTQARRKACERGARGATMPGITEEMFKRTLSLDYSEVARLSSILANVLSKVSEAHVISEAGTDIKFSLEHRRAKADTGIYDKPGSFGNLPAGEAFIAPVEGTAEGVIIVDGSIASIGLVSEPVKITVRKGFAEEFYGKEALMLKKTLESVGLREAFNLAEFGIGTNAQARISGNILEDEKAYGTVHFAFGDNSTFGGKTKAGIHLDVLVRKPTVYLDGEKIMDGGKLLIP